MKLPNMKTGCFRINRKSKSVARCMALAAVLAVATSVCAALAQSESDSKERSAADFNFDHAWLLIEAPPNASYITPPPGESDFARSGYTDPRWERVDNTADASDPDGKILEVPQALAPQDPGANPNVHGYSFVDMRPHAVPGTGTSDLSGVDTEDGNP